MLLPPDLQIELDRITLGPDDYLVLTFDEGLTPRQVAQAAERICESFPQLVGRIIIKTPRVKLATFTAEDGVHADVP